MGVTVGVANFLGQSIGIDETNTFQLKFCIYHENCGRHRLRRFLGVRVGVAYSRAKLALHTKLRNLNLKSQFLIFDSFRDIRVPIYDFLKFVGGERFDLTRFDEFYTRLLFYSLQIKTKFVCNRHSQVVRLLSFSRSIKPASGDGSRRVYEGALTRMHRRH